MTATAQCGLTASPGASGRDEDNQKILRRRSNALFQVLSRKTNYKVRATFFTCAEVNALALLLDAAPESDLKEIRITPTFNKRIHIVEHPCQNCRQWVEKSGAFFKIKPSILKEVADQVAARRERQVAVDESPAIEMSNPFSGLPEE